MHTSINISNDAESLSGFKTPADLRAFYEGFGCDGVELILCGDDLSFFEDGTVKVRGLHLVFYPEWICLWQNDFAYMDAEFGSREAWQAFYAMEKGEDLLVKYIHELDIAQRLGVEYVVFHMGDNAMDEYYTMQNRHSPEFQVKQSVEFLNRLLDGTSYTFDLLLENMWLGCMNLTDPWLTTKALTEVGYTHTGLMLDTGHLMSTNPTLKTPDEACAYVHGVLDAHGELASRVWGVHLHASLNHEYLATGPWQPPWQGCAPAEKPDYISRWCTTNGHLAQVDRHQPFEADGIPELLRRIDPKYLVYELSRGPNVDDWAAKLARAARGAGRL